MSPGAGTMAVIYFIPLIRWGIGCDATNKEAVAKVFALKQRRIHRALIVLVADERDVAVVYYSARPGYGI